MCHDARMDDTVFIDELPESVSGGRGPNKTPFRLALEAHPGQWAVYTGSPKSVYTVAKQMSTNGQVFEAAQRDGTPYMRCVKP